jgi:hypothetical protein
LLRDVIYEISSKKLGMTTVVDPSGRLLGSSPTATCDECWSREETTCSSEPPTR